MQDYIFIQYHNQLNYLLLTRLKSVLLKRGAGLITFCRFWDLDTCLIQVVCLIEVTTKTGFTVICFTLENEWAHLQETSLSLFFVSLLGINLE